MSIICTPVPPPYAVTIAYVLAPIVNISTSSGYVSTTESKLNAFLATMFSGSLMSIICTPLSKYAATIAYVLAPIVNISTSLAPFNISAALSDIVFLATMFSGSLISYIRTPPLIDVESIAYVLAPIVNVSKPKKCLSSGPLTNTESFSTMFVG